MTQDRIMKALKENKSKGKQILPFRELVKRVNEGVPDKEKIKSKNIREAIGALKHQGKIDSEIYSNREFFYLVESERNSK
jgi:hypothetical protein